MSIAVNNTHKEYMQKTVLTRGLLTFSSNYTTGGDTLNFNTATNNPGECNVEGTSVPKSVKITGVSGYTYVYIPGTTRANGKVEVLQGGAVISLPQAQIPGAPTAYPAGVTGDVVTFEATFSKAGV